MRFPCVVVTLLVLVLSSAAAQEAAPEREWVLRFWEIAQNNFSAQDPVAVPSPLESGPAFYYAWPFALRYKVNLDDLRERLQAALDEAEEGSVRGQFLQNALERVDSELEGAPWPLKLRIALHTNTGETYYDLSSPTLRNLAEKQIGRELQTTDEIASAELKQGDVVHGVALFPEIEPEADGFEIRVIGLGRRLYPAFYPRHVTRITRTAQGQYTKPQPHMRKALRYFYDRPGDAAHRQADPVLFRERRQDWLWLWHTNFYAQEPGTLVLNRSVATGGGTRELAYPFRYYSYEVLNTTPDPQEVKVTAAGLVPQVDWHEVSIVVPLMDRAAETDHRKAQALRVLQRREPTLVQDIEARHVQATVPPGRKVRGLAFAHARIEAPEALLDEVVMQLHGLARRPEDPDEPGALLARYRRLYPAAENRKPVLERKTQPSDEVVSEFVLAQAAEDVAARDLEISKQDKIRYEGLAPFAILMSHLAGEAVDRLAQDGEVPVRYEVELEGRADAAQFVYSFEEPTPPEQPIYAGLGEVEEPEEAEPEAGAEAEEAEEEPAQEPTTEEEAIW